MNSLKINHKQTIVVSKYLSDVSKISFASLVVNFFIKSTDYQITWAAFASGLVGMLLSFGFSVYLSK